MKRLILFMCLSNISTGVYAQLQSVSVIEFEKQLYSTKAVQLIDIRTPQEFENYRIKSAANIDFRGAHFRKEIEKLDKNKPVLIYCLSGNRSKSALPIFREAGFKIVFELNEGINGWIKASKPIDEDLTGKGEISIKEYDSVTSLKGYVLVDYYAPWCAPCQKMLPVVQNLEKTYFGKFKLLTINFDENRLLAKTKNVKSVPLLLIFKNGKKIWEKTGEATEEELIKVLKLKD